MPTGVQPCLKRGHALGTTNVLAITLAMLWAACAYHAGLENLTNVTWARFQARVLIRAIEHAMSRALLRD